LLNTFDTSASELDFLVSRPCIQGETYRKMQKMSRSTIALAALEIIVGIAILLAILFLSLPTTPITQQDPIAARIGKMSLEQKIGQLLIVGFRAPSVDNHIRTMITRYHIGGINLLGRNVKSEEQAEGLIRDLHTLNISATGIPLFMATDQEGGAVSRFTFMKELAPQPDIATVGEARRIAKARGEELREIGINVNFAPLADYVTDPNAYLWDRVFHGTPEEIAARAGAMLQGYREAGILSVLKHFPGYGNEEPDPHTAATTLVIDNTTLENNLLPFRELVARQNAEMIMTAHILIPSVDKKPATHSKVFLTDILRTQWGFEGVIMTDDLEMASAGTDVGTSALEALRAGADMLIITPTPEKQLAAISRLIRAVQNGELPESRVDESLRRVLALKQRIYESTERYETTN
jgi:beta-N-acetylhexosaminidase